MTAVGNTVRRTIALWLVTAIVAWPTATAQQEADPDALLEDFPVASRVWLGAIVGEVSVDPVTPIDLNRPGELVWQVEDGAPVEEGDVVALTGHQKITLSASQLRIQQSRRRHDIQDITWATEEKVRGLKNSIAEQEQYLEKLSLTRTERELLGVKFEERLADERAEAESQLKKMRDRLEGDYFDELDRLEKESIDLELQAAEQDHEDLIRNSEVLAPATGSLRILHRGNISRAKLLGEIVKTGLAEAELELSDPRLRSVPGEELEVEILGDDGLAYPGFYLREAEKQGFGQNTRTVVMEIYPAEEGAEVPPTLEGSRMITIFRTLPEPGHLVPKAPLVFSNPEEIGRDGWNRFVTKRWPDSRIIYIGPREIVIAKAGEN